MDNLETFILDDPKGKKLLKYFLFLNDNFAKTQQKLEETIDQVDEKVRLIRNLIVTQEKYVGVETLLEKVDTNKAISDILTISESSSAFSGITIEEHFGSIPEITVHKTKFVFILTCLIQNAVDAMAENQKEKNLSVTTEKQNNGVLIRFCDTGHGIEEMLLKKIFFQGFSTKNDHYGFGLHTCAIYMNEIGGKIWAESEGNSKGATLHLWFPLLGAISSN